MDTTNNDVVTKYGPIENTLLHFSPQQEWYYLSAMDASDVLVFRNVDSSGVKARE